MCLCVYICVKRVKNWFAAWFVWVYDFGKRVHIASTWLNLIGEYVAHILPWNVQCYGAQTNLKWPYSERMG